jgi:predicted nuclease of predicted toxin-antitoxin system
MSLLFDHHLSRRLVKRLADVFPAASHVALHGLAEADDSVIWAFARQAGLAIVTKDSDFNDLVLLHGAPPKVIWVRIGNCTTGEVEGVLRQQRTTIHHFLQDPSTHLLELIPSTQ